MDVAVLQIERAQQRVDFIGLFVSVVVGMKFSPAKVRFLLVEELEIRTTKKTLTIYAPINTTDLFDLLEQFHFLSRLLGVSNDENHQSLLVLKGSR